MMNTKLMHLQTENQKVIYQFSSDAYAKWEWKSEINYNPITCDPHVRKEASCHVKRDEGKGDNGVLWGKAEVGKSYNVAEDWMLCGMEVGQHITV